MNMRCRLIAVLSAVSVMICMLAQIMPASASSEKVNYGSIVSAVYNEDTNVIDISGTLTHNALVSMPDGQIGLIRIAQGADENKSIAENEPVSVLPISVKYEFKIHITSLEERIACYAVVIMSGDKRITVASPMFIGCSSKLLKSPAMKGIASAKITDVVNNSGSSSIIDISVGDILGGNSGYCFGVFGKNYFFNREITDTFDTAVRTYLAGGVDVYLRLKNPERVFYSSQSASDVYAVLAFLFSRANKIGLTFKGIIAGHAADSVFEGDAGEKNYGLLLGTIGNVIDDYSSECGLIIPLSDRVNPDGHVTFADFISNIATYVDNHTELRLSLMFECFLNPYGLNENSPAGPEEIDTQEENIITESIADITTDSPDISSADVNSSAENSDAPISTIDVPVETSSPEQTKADPIPEITDPVVTEPVTEWIKPVPNDISVGFYTVENLSLPISVFQTLKKQHKCMSQYWMLSWHPQNDTGDTLASCYIYSYLSAQALGASVFFADFDVIGEDAFDDISYHFENINSGKSASIIDSGYEYFGIVSWSEIIDGTIRSSYSDMNVYEQSLSEKTPEYQGKYSIWDFTYGNDILGWYSGIGCSSLKSFSDSNDGGIRAEFVGREYADIGIICESPEPLLAFDALGFDIAVVSDDTDALFELKIFLYSENTKVEASSAIVSGERKNLYVTTSDLPSNASITAVRVCIRPIIGLDADEYGLEIHKVNVYSNTYGNTALANLVNSARADLLPESDEKKDTNASVYVYSSIAVVFSAMLIIGFAAADKKRKNNEK